MSNIYINEPPTSGKVLVVTSLGDIDVELWGRETPKACRNFVQLCMEGYYDGLTFHRIVPGFCAQGGDPTGTGQGGESIYGRPFKDEIHQRLRFNRRGLVAMANAGKDDNGSQFFFTLGPTPELDKKHTIFGKVTGDTLYNMLRLGELEIGPDDRPVYPPKIIKTEIIDNPFSDITPRENLKKKEKEKEKTDKKSKSKAVKNFSVLSFGNEAEDDENELDDVIEKKFKHKSKSLHDANVDPNMVADPVLEVVESRKRKAETTERKAEKKAKFAEQEGLEEDSEEDSEEERDRQMLSVKEKLKKKEKGPEETKKELSDSEDEEKKEKRKKVEELQEESRRLMQELKPKTNKGNEKEPNGKEQDVDLKTELTGNEDEVTKFKVERQKYVKQQKDMKKGQDRKDLTLQMLAKFKNKVKESQELKISSEDIKDEPDKEEEEEREDIDLNDPLWLTHQMQGEILDPVLAKDANVQDEDRFEIFDPRNPLNERRRKDDQQNKKSRDKDRRKEVL